MKKNFLMAIVLSAMTMMPIYAEEQTEDKKEENEKKISYSVALDIGTTYIWRMNDVYAPALKDQSTIFPLSPGIFPSITIGSEDSGWEFNIWAAASVLNRGSDNGELKAYDEIDLTGKYSVKDKSGTFAYYLIGYLYPTSGSSGLAASYAEMVFNYTAPVILNPSVTIAAALASAEPLATEYASLSISHDFEAGIVTISPKLLFGYWYYNANPELNKGHFDLMVPVSIELGETVEIHAMIDGCFRAIGFDPSFSPFILVGTLGATFNF